MYCASQTVWDVSDKIYTMYVSSFSDRCNWQPGSRRCEGRPGNRGYPRGERGERAGRRLTLGRQDALERLELLEKKVGI